MWKAGMGNHFYLVQLPVEIHVCGEAYKQLSFCESFVVGCGTGREPIVVLSYFAAWIVCVRVPILRSLQITDRKGHY